MTKTKNVVKALYTVAKSNEYYDTYSDREAYDALYCDALVQQAVDVPVRDSLSSWREAVDSEFQKLDISLGVKKVLIQAGIDARKYGRAMIIPVITDINDNRVPLNRSLDLILENSENYKLVKFIVAPSFEANGIRESNILSENYGNPRSYKVNGGTVNASRAIIVSANSMGTSFIASINDYLQDFKSRNSETTKAVEESNWLAFGTDLAMLIENARALTEAKGSGDAEAIVADLLQNRTRELRQNATNTNAWAYDKNAETVTQVAKTNIDAMVNSTEQAAKFLASAADIPMSRFLGYRAGGLSADGDGNYRQTLIGLRASMFEDPLSQLDKIIVSLNPEITSGEFEWKEIEF